ncbi:hypothetical protein ACHWQZ_G001346 [Mnemiopsis leidyi]
MGTIENVFGVSSVIIATLCHLTLIIWGAVERNNAGSSSGLGWGDYLIIGCFLLGVLLSFIRIWQVASKSAVARMLAISIGFITTILALMIAGNLLQTIETMIRYNYNGAKEIILVVLYMIAGVGHLISLLHSKN